MLGILLMIVLYSALVLICERKINDGLGLIPSAGRLKCFFAGFVAAGLIVIINILIETLARAISWELKDPVRFFAIADKVWLFFIAVLTEELFFRGVILYVLLRIAREQLSIWICSACFGVYHWFSYGMLGAPIIPLAYVFITTFLAGYCFSLAYLKSRTLFLPVGMHFGWNTINSFFNAQGSYNEILFVKISAAALGEGANLLLSLLTGILPSVLMCFYVCFKFKRRAPAAGHQKYQENNRSRYRHWKPGRSGNA